MKKKDPNKIHQATEIKADSLFVQYGLTKTGTPVKTVLGKKPSKSRDYLQEPSPDKIITTKPSASFVKSQPRESIHRAGLKISTGLERINKPKKK
jgi:hypothetical protein